jgi:hypothetical protein
MTCSTARYSPLFTSVGRLPKITANAAASVFLIWILSMPSQADPILKLNLTSPAEVPICTLHPGAGDEKETGYDSKCTATALRPFLANWNTAFLTGNFDGIAPTTQTFETTFGNWKMAEGANYGGNWVEKNGGTLNLTFNVTDTAYADDTFGGISPFQITVTKNKGYKGPALTQLVWTQALYDSYSTQPPYLTDLRPPLNTLDTWSTSKGNSGAGGAFLRPCEPIPGQMPGKRNKKPATIPPSQRSPNILGYCDPIYPFQYADAAFSDGPKAFWPDESFRAIALLSTVTFVTNRKGVITERDLTVYNGIDWGFDLSATPIPEPETVLFTTAALALLVVLSRKRYSKTT